MQIGLHLYFEALGFVVSLLCYRRLKGSFMVWFVPFLGFVVFVEALGQVIDFYKLPTAPIYYMAAPVYATFYTFVFISFAQNRTHKRVLFWINLGYVLFYCIYATVTGQWFSRLNQDLLVAGFIEMVLFSCLFFYQCLSDDQDTEQAKYRSGLWIAAGVMIFYCGLSFCYSLYPYIAKHDLRIQGKRLYAIIPKYLCIALYSCLSISFLVWKKPVKNL